MRFSAALRDEWLLARRHGVLLAALGALAVLLIVAATNGRALITQRLDESQRIAQEASTMRSALAEQAARGAPTALSPGTIGYSVLFAPASLPPAPLAALAIGQSDLLPAHYRVTARGSHQFMAAPSLDNSLRLTLGSFDVAFVIVWLVPLIVIALMFDLVAGDRERGVLTIALAQGVKLEQFVLYKAAARYLLSAPAIVVAVVLAALIAGGASATIDLLLCVLALLLYVAFWFALALWINSKPRSSDQNATLLAGAWLLLVVLLPAATNLVATTLFPAPSRVTLTTELREASAEADRAAAAARDQYFFDHPDMAAGEVDQTVFYKSVADSESQIAQAMRPLLDQFDVQAAAQRRVVAALQYLSPGTILHQLLTAVAGTDGARHQDFRDQVRDFHARWSQFFEQRLRRSQLLSANDYAALPGFEFSPPTPAKLLGQSLGPLLLLVALCAALVWSARRRLRGYTVV